MSDICSEKIYDGRFGGRRCVRKVSVTVDGKHFCSIHSPEGVAKRNAKKLQRWDEERAASIERFKREKEERDSISRKLAVHDDLVAALREIQITAVDADLRASYHRIALERISAKAREALEKVST